MSWDVIGHEWAVKLLKKHIADQRMRRAYLFVGPEAIGKRTLALCFAQAICCEQSAGLGEACGECRACQHIASETYPDLEVLAPDPTIQVDAVRALQRRLALAPYEGRWKIALLEDFHLATTSAANAMLKTLEEPPKQVVLLLTAVAREQLLPTVTSRCEVIPLRRVPAEAISRALESLGSDQAEMLAVLSEGRPGRALRWHANPTNFEQRALALDQLREALSLDIQGRFALADRIVGKGKLAIQRKRVRSTLESWLSLWRDLLYQGYGARVRARNLDRMQAFGQATQSIGAAERYQVVSAISSTLEAVDGNANLRLAVEALLLKLPAVG